MGFHNHEIQGLSTCQDLLASGKVAKRPEKAEIIL
jgi:hypothetical protein